MQGLLKSAGGLYTWCLFFRLVSMCEAQNTGESVRPHGTSRPAASLIELGAIKHIKPYLRSTGESSQHPSRTHALNPEAGVSRAAAVEYVTEEVIARALKGPFSGVTTAQSSAAKTKMTHAVRSTSSFGTNSTEESPTPSEVEMWLKERSKEPLATSPKLAETTEPPRKARFFDTLRNALKKLMSEAGRTVVRKFLHADISTECSLGLLKFTRAIQELEPWGLRLLDATGKYPTGFFQISLADLGAYDECIETVARDADGVVQVRGQYCDVQLKVGDNSPLVPLLLPAVAFSNKKVAEFQGIVMEPRAFGVRLGLCFIDSCNEKDVANIGRTRDTDDGYAPFDGRDRVEVGRRTTLYFLQDAFWSCSGFSHWSPDKYNVSVRRQLPRQSKYISRVSQYKLRLENMVQDTPYEKFCRPHALLESVLCEADSEEFAYGDHVAFGEVLRIE